MAEYEVDMKTISCSCPDWRTSRSHLPVGHFSRFCKHAFTAYFNVEIEGPPAVMEFLSNAFPPHPEKEWILKPLSDGGDLILISSPTPTWADVYAIGNKGWGRFGYNVDEERWSYGISPKQSDKIIALLNKDFSDYL